MSLLERLRERIAREGPMSFADFMEAALFDPEEGYYARGAAIGEGGDFVTSPHVSPAFAGTLARLFAVDTDGFRPGPSTSSRSAPGDGRFLADLAGWLGAGSAELSARVSASRRWRLRPRAARRIRARGIAPAPRVLASVDELPGGLRDRVDLLERALRRAPGDARVGSPEGVRELRVERDPEGEGFAGSQAPRRPPSPRTWSASA